MRIKLNGRQRIGIVLSMIWFVGFALWFSHATDLSICDALRREPLKNGGNENGLWTEHQLAGCRGNVHGFYWNIVVRMFATDFGVIILGWLIAWLGIVSVRWIRRGLRKGVAFVAEYRENACFGFDD